MSVRNDLNIILDGIGQSSLTDEEWGGVSLSEAPTRLQIYQSLITILGLREDVTNTLYRLKGYALGVDDIALNTNTSQLEADKPKSEIYIGASLE
jgi:hypothetical protein